MKKLLSLLLTFALIFILALPCFAASVARFNINLVSETNTEAVISIDYEGGSTFACFDFELKYNSKKLQATQAYDGDGGIAFAKAAKREGGAVISVINPETNPIKGTMATTVDYKNVDGKDIFIVKFKKLVKDNLTGSDISLVFTNCMNNKREIIKTEVTSSLTGKGEPIENSSAPSNNDAVTEQSSSQTVSTEVQKTDDIQQSSESSSEALENEAAVSDKATEPEIEKPSNNKKIIVVASAAAVMVAIIVAGCIYVVKKTKNDGENQ